MAEHQCFTIDKDVPKAFNLLKQKRKSRWLMLTLDQDACLMKILQEEKDKTKDLTDLLKLLPDADCCFVVFEHEFSTADGRKTDKLYFINWFPRACNPRVKMRYTTERPGLLKKLCPTPRDTVQFHITASTKDEISSKIEGKKDGDHVDEDEVEENDDWMDD